ncbi:MAG: tRNA (cytidine(56)-2'-O)-methyltransferase [Candidatus Diapherotrites archaeon]|nr:tRNA (cytidine(56)-2'-O)-methyltransferase [Candidatus Diapherotrites archaeon]
MEIVVLRYGHRDYRDLRVTSHCCLVARAFGAKKIIIEGNTDESIVKTVEGVNKNWGSNFKVEFSDSWKKVLKEYKNKKFFAVHLTMYGVPIQKAVQKIRRHNKLLIIIGSQKVVAEVYQQANLNVSVTTQPHSEIAALAVALDKMQKGKELEKRFPKAKIRIVPQEKGKKIVKR